MDNNNSFQTSFIPKKPINTTISSVGGERRHGGSLVSISVAIIVITIVVLGGLYFYKNYLVTQKDNLSISLDKVKNSFDQDTINELELFDKRISASNEALSKHIILSPMFDLIGSLTIPLVQYTKFAHENKDNNFTVQMSGVSPDYKTIATQAEMFNSAKGRLFKNIVFSNLNKDKQNNVTFDVAFSVDPSLLSYENNILTTAQ